MSIFSINAISQPKKTELIKARRRMLRYSLITKCYVTIFVIAQVSFTSLYTSLLSDLIHNVKAVYTKHKKRHLNYEWSTICKLLQLLKPLLHNHSPIKVCYRVPSLYSFHLSTACSKTHILKFHALDDAS